MKTTFRLLMAFLLMASHAYADYTTPNTAIKWNLDELVTNSGGNVTFSSGEYQVNGIITISPSDTISITTNAVVKFAAGTHFLVNGSLKIDAPNEVLFTAQVPATGFNGIKFDNSAASVIRKLTLEYAVSCNISDCSPVIDSCIFRYNNVGTSTSFGNGAISLFRSKAVITHTRFLNNRRAAIQGGGNIANAPYISNCVFSGNNTTNQNVPQINMGGSGTDTTKIFNNQFLAASTNSGGLGFLPIGIDLRVLITGNLIQNNRYGINLQGGSLVNAVVSYNVIEDNNTGNNPATGGSGIAFAGGSSTSHQNSIVTGNIIKGNLWGITIQNGAKPNLGNLANADTTDDGKNWFYGNSNTNATTPGIHLYNNSPDAISAQGNYWGSNDPVAIEASIYHQPDAATLGLVDYSAQVLPVQLIWFTASVKEKGTQLDWKVASETKLQQYEVERSMDGANFMRVGVVASAGLTRYSFFDNTAAPAKTAYYRLKMADKDGVFQYSQVILVKPAANNAGEVKVYVAAPGQVVAAITSNQPQEVQLAWYDASGKLLGKISQQVLAGKTLIPLSHLPAKGKMVWVQVVTGSGQKTVPVIM